MYMTADCCYLTLSYCSYERFRTVHCLLLWWAANGFERFTAYCFGELRTVLNGSELRTISNGSERFSSVHKNSWFCKRWVVNGSERFRAYYLGELRTVLNGSQLICLFLASPTWLGLGPLKRIKSINQWYF